MSAWTIAGSLEQLRAQLDEAAPRRSKVSDGAIGDAAHATRASDHNPWFVLNGQAYVTARDFTHDPAGGLDCGRLAVALRNGRDPRVKYVIWNRAIMSGADGPSPWVWRSYNGANPHTRHLHLSVVADLRGLTRIPWQLSGGVGPTPAQPPADSPAQPQLTYGMRLHPTVRKVQFFLVRAFPSYAAGLPDTGNYYDETARVVAEFQRRTGITGPDADGRTIGPRTWAQLVAHGYR